MVKQDCRKDTATTSNTRRAGTHQQAVRGMIALATPSVGSCCEHSLVRKVWLAFEHSFSTVSSSSSLFDVRSLNWAFTNNPMT